MADDFATFADVWPGRAPARATAVAVLDAPEPRRCARVNKIRHHNRRAALVQMATLQDDELMNVYRCTYCGDWHVGHL